MKVRPHDSVSGFTERWRGLLHPPLHVAPQAETAERPLPDTIQMSDFSASETMNLINLEWQIRDILKCPVSFEDKEEISKFIFHMLLQKYRTIQYA